MLLPCRNEIPGKSMCYAMRREGSSLVTGLLPTARQTGIGLRKVGLADYYRGLNNCRHYFGGSLV